MLEVKFKKHYRTIQCESSLSYNIFVNQERKLGESKRSDTVVILTINYTDRGLERYLFLKDFSRTQGKPKVFVFQG